VTAPEPVVITGAGLATALGLTVPETWDAVRRGQCGIRPLTAVESPLSPNKGGGQAPDLPPDRLRDRPREVAYLERAVAEAVADAGLNEACPYPVDRRGIVLGTTLAGIRSGGAYFRTDDPGALQSFIAGSALRDITPAFVAGGFTATTSAACASGLASLGLAMTLLRSGMLDVVVAGGYDPISEYVYAGFNSLRLVAEGPPRPFSAAREGM
jgi:3-oxoacyl-[acyl-carrier-protein] synthase II